MPNVFCQIKQLHYLKKVHHLRSNKYEISLLNTNGLDRTQIWINENVQKPDRILLEKLGEVKSHQTSSLDGIWGDLGLNQTPIFQPTQSPTASSSTHSDQHLK